MNAHNYGYDDDDCDEDIAYYHASCIECKNIVAGCCCMEEEEEMYEEDFDHPLPMIHIGRADDGDYVGMKLCSFAGAPGTGRIVYHVEKIDSGELYGSIIENTIRILEPWEVM